MTASPAVGLVAPASVGLSASTGASDGATVTKVAYYSGSAPSPFATVTLGSPYSYQWTGLAAGTYSVTAKATDSMGTISNASNTMTFTVAPGASGIVTSNSPCTLTGTNTTCSVTLNWSGSGANFFCLWASPTAIFSCQIGTGSWSIAYPWVTVAPSQVVLKAHASSPSSGADYAAGTTLAIATVYANPALHMPPTVSMTASPTTGLVAPASVGLSATAGVSDGATITKVAYYSGSATTPFATVTSGSPYRYLWTGLAAGTYTVTAKATDSMGATSNTSSAATIVVAANSGDTCYPLTPIDVKNCILRLRAGQSHSILITNTINCSAASECAFDMTGFPTTSNQVAVVISGQKSTNPSSGFKRTTNYNYPIFNLSNTSGVTIENINFDDSGSTNGTSSDGILNILNSSNVIVTNSAFSGGKFSAIALRASNNILISNNQISSTQEFAIWGDNSASGVSSNVTISGNTISDTWANGIIISLVNSRIVYNEFLRNHDQTLFATSGGQLDIEKNTNHLYVGCNYIHDGLLPPPYVVAGIEFAPTDINSVEVTGNRIINNDGFAIAIDYGNINVSGIVIHNNSVSGNAFNSNTNSQYDYKDYTPQIYGNCTDSSCVTSCN